MAKEFKSLDGIAHVEITDEDAGIVEHLVSVFGVEDRLGDVVHRGAFTKTLAERGGSVLVLDNHRTTGAGSVLGKPLSLREVGREELPTDVLDKYPDATGGLKAETQFAMATQAGREAFELLKMGALREWSFAYDIVRKDWSTPKGASRRVRNLREVKLYEYSPVLIAANPAAVTVGVKSDDEDVEGLRQAVLDLRAELDVMRAELEKKGLFSGGLPEATDAGDPVTDAEPTTPDAEPDDAVDPLTSEGKSLTPDRARQVKMLEAELGEIDLLTLEL